MFFKNMDPGEESSGLFYCVSAVLKPVYSLRMMSMARGGGFMQLGSMVLLDPLSMVAAVGGFIFQVICYIHRDSVLSTVEPLLLLTLLSLCKVTRSVLKLSTEGYLPPRHPKTLVAIAGPASFLMS